MVSRLLDDDMTLHGFSRGTVLSPWIIGVDISDFGGGVVFGLSDCSFTILAVMSLDSEFSA